jgi:YspA, cpYpsA-related SLOG family
MLRVGVIGSRSFINYDIVKSVLDRIEVREIVSGGAKGADTLGERYAEEKGIPTNIYYPDWKTHGRIAGFLRNTDIVKNSDVVLAFWDGESRGTMDSLKKCVKLGIPYKIILPDGSELREIPS